MRLSQIGKCPGHCSTFICCSVSKSCLPLCDPINCRIPCPSPPPSLLRLMCFESVLTYCQYCDSVYWCHPNILSSFVPFSSCLQSPPASGSFPMSWLFVSGGQTTGASALASALPMNIQGWFPLGLTGLISLLFKGLSRIFSTTTVWKYRYSTNNVSCLFLQRGSDSWMPAKQHLSCGWPCSTGSCSCN